jgi:hypothetical protein
MWDIAAVGPEGDVLPNYVAPGRPQGQRFSDPFQALRIP